MEALIFAERVNFGRYIQLHLAQKKADLLDSIFVAQPVAFVEQPEDAYMTPFLKLSPHDAQSLMDELWKCGLRPTEGSGSAGSLAATERHLADMQKIAFNLIDRTNQPTRKA